MFKVQDSNLDRVGAGIARLSPSEMDRYGLRDGEIVEIEGGRRTPVRVKPLENQEDGVISLDYIARENAGIAGDGNVMLYKTNHEYASSVTLIPLSPISESDLDREILRSKLKSLPVKKEDHIRITGIAGRNLDMRVSFTMPGGVVLISPSTEINLAKPELRDVARDKVKYSDIGGLSSQIKRIREMIELPLRFPEAFIRLGVEPPKGVLLYGPPGTGKTVIARAVANESDAWFTHISGPEVIGKYYGESEERLRAVFEEAQANAPSIIFMDEVDAIAPKREEMGGEKQVERRVVSQLLTLMDGLSSRGQVVVIAATNIPNSLDPALRRPGRFDREISIPIPDRIGRLEILKIHTRNMPLAEDVNLERLADITHGFVGADLEALAKEAAMSTIRKVLPSIDFDAHELPSDSVLTMEITMSDFMTALREVEASAIREFFVEVPDIYWSDIGGLEDIKNELVEAVEWPLMKDELFRKYGVVPPRGIMLHGPSGTGKTLIVKALAHETGVNFISVKGPELMSRFVGESERAIREVFKTARQAAPSILFFDEIDSLVPIRGLDKSTGSQYTERVIGQFLSEMSGIEEMEGVVVIATTNRIEAIDPAMFSAGRFEKILELPMPDINAREQIFAMNLKSMPLSPELNFQHLAMATEGKSGADIASICRNALTQALREYIKADGQEEPCLELRHFSIK